MRKKPPVLKKERGRFFEHGFEHGQNGRRSVRRRAVSRVYEYKLLHRVQFGFPQKDRTIVEYRFYRNMQVKEIAAQVGLSSSRITRIVQSALNYVREYLQKREHYGY